MKTWNSSSYDHLLTFGYWCVHINRTFLWMLIVGRHPHISCIHLCTAIFFCYPMRDSSETSHAPHLSTIPLLALSCRGHIRWNIRFHIVVDIPRHTFLPISIQHQSCKWKCCYVCCEWRGWQWYTEGYWERTQMEMHLQLWSCCLGGTSVAIMYILMKAHIWLVYIGYVT